MGKIYAVKRGLKTGLFNSWDECKKQVTGVKGARFKGFTDVNEAEKWLLGEAASGQELPKSINNSFDDAADYIIYTDGSCLKNPAGPGGWAAVVMDQVNGELTELHSGEPSTTNNRMELTAAIAALNFIRDGAVVDLYTDSQYLKNAFTKHWLAGWKQNGWKTAAGSEVKNKDLWQKLDKLFSAHQVRFYWVKGHVGIEHNERCDVLAKSEAMKFW